MEDVPVSPLNDSQGVPQNLGVGHGWVEGGPLFPVRSELYQSALGSEALRALSNTARLIGKDVSGELSADFSKQEQMLNQAFWLTFKKRFAFALDTNGKPVDEPSVLATVPMWFGLLREDKALPMISLLTGPDHETDWGMRIISSEASKYGGGGYHYGSVWPLFTGWASVGEYRYHRALPAYAYLRANALLALDGSLGHYRGSFGRLLSAPIHEFTPPDLVGGHGGQPTPARTAGAEQ